MALRYEAEVGVPQHDIAGRRTRGWMSAYVDWADAHPAWSGPFASLRERGSQCDRAPAGRTGLGDQPQLRVASEEP